MRVIVMDTGRGIGPDKVAMWRAHLGLGADDQLSLVSWFTPKATLPLFTHLVCGPVLRLGQEPQDWAVQDPEPEPTSEHEAQQSEASRPWTGAEGMVDATSGGLGILELDQQLSEQEAGPAQAAAADQQPVSEDQDDDVNAGRDRRSFAAGPVVAADRSAPTGAPVATSTDLSHLPVHDPSRLRQAVRWRRKRAQRRASRFASRQVRRARAFKDRNSHLPSVAVSRSLRGRKDAISWEFALAATGSRTVRQFFRTADVVVPVDGRSQKAAWLLARRYEGPHVVVTLPAAARLITLQRERS